ncbi:MAG: fibronectin type III domain-containing protein [Myxococcota bacterium]|nr:fibronectin type III domain-containing protein [Myxococcota bacterium]
MKLAIPLSMLLAAGCVLESPPIDGLGCPCTSGWTCVAEQCVPASGPCARNAEAGRIAIENLRAEWVTANQIRVAWDAPDISELFAYEVDVASSEVDLWYPERRHVVTSSENPELLRASLPGTNDGDPVLATTVRDLAANEPYFIRVVAIDRDRGVTCTEALGVSTGPRVRESITLFHDSGPDAAEPSCLDQVEDPSRSRESDTHWAWVAHCREDQTAHCVPQERPGLSCYENLQVRGLGRDATSLTEVDFDEAFLQVSVAIEGDHGFWSELGVETAVGDHFILGGLTLVGDGEYHTYQVPLSAMWRLSYADIRGVINGFRVGTLWVDEAVVRIDEAAIYW